MIYSHDMSSEHENKDYVPKKLIPAGWRKMQITDCVEAISKAGNEMFIFTFLDVEEFMSEKVWAISVPGKRWMLKNILESCGIGAAEDHVYSWYIADVIDKTVEAKVKHFDEKWTNDKGEEKNSIKAKIVAVRGERKEQPTNKITREDLAKGVTSNSNTMSDEVKQKLKNLAEAKEGDDAETIPF